MAGKFCHWPRVHGQAHLRRDPVTKVRSLQGKDIVNGDSYRLFGQMPLFDGEFLRIDADLLQPANGNERFGGTFFHAFD